MFWAKGKSMLLVLTLGLILGGYGMLMKSPPNAPAAPERPRAAHATNDRFGDSLPPGALLRLGTV
jgi:hypothetical protein